MRVGLLSLSLHLVGVTSLKEKRSILKRIVADVGRAPNLAIGEVGAQDDLRRAVLRIAHVSNDPRRTQSVLMKWTRALDREDRIDVETVDVEIL
ncbi:DUF503 domain-containing protein [Candidatus Bipolaricaulota bacterium]|nr:DUF503 domain-containing protein [Candidatus Bipolaricaulota bacterium]